MTDPQTPDPLEGALLDHLLGAGDPSGDPAVVRALAADPALARHKAALEALLRAEDAAHAAALDAGAAARVAARVRDRVGRLERMDERAAREPRRASRATRWARVLAVSIAAHAALLAFVSVWMGHSESPARRDDDDERLFAEVGSDDLGDPLAALPLEPPGAPGATDVPALAWGGEPLPAERVLLEPPEALEPPRASGGDDRFSFPRVRAMALRMDDRLKSRLSDRLGLPGGTLARVRRSLDAIAERQAPDGSFDPAPGRGRAYATAIAVLPFLGDGQSSRSGAHQAQVAGAVSWLRHNAATTASPAERGAVTLALAEDAMLSHGSLTPAEAEARRAELAVIGASLAEAAPRGSKDPADEVWPSLARRALARAGIAPSGDGAASPWTTVLASASPSDFDDPSAALFQGTAILLADRGKDGGLARWGEGVGRALLGRLDPETALARDGGSDAERVETTALVLLALEVVFRTY